MATDAIRRLQKQLEIVEQVGIIGVFHAHRTLRQMQEPKLLDNSGDPLECRRGRGDAMLRT